jgi:uncharacterized membrane protein (UPF0127 family)
MKKLRVSLPDGSPLALEALQSERTHERVQGWLGRDGVRPGEGLLLVPCGSIHTLGMRFTIDVAFLDRQGRVQKLCPQVKPGRLVWAHWRGLLFPWRVMALELPAGALAQAGVQVGQRLQLDAEA